ncbi:MAG: hypothetical protein A49_05630 [Methyloceanibacter sp.]|nr:MAG: hypothetical protein A49_05630 [Methyloceanibacter sp.]
MHRASRLAQIEFDEGVPATYFVFLRSPFLNLLSPQVSEQVRKILSLGHDLALHFDPTFYSDPTSDDCVSRIEYERDVLADEFGQVATAISFHNFGALDPGLFANDIIAGMVNAYGKTLRDTHGYVSDSNGVWLHRRLKSVLEEAKEDRLQVLTHPEWWTPEVMPPRLRVQRAIDGQAAAIGQWYDEAVAKHGRPNFR